MGRRIKFSIMSEKESVMLIELVELVEFGNLLDELCDVKSAKRGLLGRLHHHRVAHRQRRREFPGLHHQRHIPLNAG